MLNLTQARCIKFIILKGLYIAIYKVHLTATIG